jgi:hypothetical protein
MGCWRTINGNRVWIENCGEAWKATLLVTVALASASGATVGAGSAVGGSGVSVSADVSVRINPKARDRSSRSVVRRLERAGFRIRPQFEVSDSDCAAHSYGEVQRWFRDNPCDALYRALFEVRDRRGGLVLVAVATVDMPDVGGAIEFKYLVDRHGTGNVTELSRERGRYRNVRFTGEFYASRREDTTVVNAQAQPVGRGARAVELAEIVRVAVG